MDYKNIVRAEKEEEEEKQKHTFMMKNMKKRRKLKSMKKLSICKGIRMNCGRKRKEKS